MRNCYDIVKSFEEQVANYVGSPYAVAVDSCTSALFLCCKYLKVQEVIVPKKTYLSVPMSVIHAGGTVKFVDKEWDGIYYLDPYPIVDAAKRFTSGMYHSNTYMCLSFHVKKVLKMGKGGMILTDNAEAMKWFKRARYQGRNEVFYKDDEVEMLGWNMYMTPEQAGRGMMLMQNISLYNEDDPEDGGYRDLTEFKIFKNDSTPGACR